MDAVTINKLFADLVAGGISADHAVKLIIAKLDAESRHAVATLYVDANKAQTQTIVASQKES